MGLLINFITFLNLWRPEFCKQKLFERVRALAIGFVSVIHRKTIANVSLFLGNIKKGYEANCAVFSRRKWDPVKLFDHLLKPALSLSKDPYVCVAADDTHIKKSGKKIKGAGWKKDPLSPAFHLNFLWALRFLQFSLLIQPSSHARAIPIDFIEAPSIKKPGKRAPSWLFDLYKRIKKMFNLSFLFVQNIKKLRQRLDQAGENRPLLMVVDGSFCNKACMSQKEDRIEILARCKKNASLCFAYLGPSKRRKYSQEKFSPEQIRQDRSYKQKGLFVFYGGKRRLLFYKEVRHVLWQRGTGLRPLRLLVLAPTSYRKAKRGRLYYRKPAFLLCTDLQAEASFLIQAYLNRWQIEVNHREEKSILGVGETQVWSPKSVDRQPAFHVAVYSCLLLSAALVYQDKPLYFDDDPKWRKPPKRLTFRAMLGIMRSEILSNPDILSQIDIHPVEIACLLKQAA